METAALLPVLLRYLHEPSTWVAVITPALLSGVFLWLTRGQGMGRTHALQWVLGTLITVQFSFWRETEGVLTLHLVSGYALVLILVPLSQRPSSLRAFALCFLSMLTADVCCAVQRMLDKFSTLPVDFFYGVGGAGLGDALLLMPIGCAALTWLFSWVEPKEYASVPLSQLLQGKRPRTR